MMIGFFTIYDMETGRIRTTISGGRDLAELNCFEGEAIAEGDWDEEEWYFPSGVRAALPRFTPVAVRMLVADGSHETTFSNLPADTILRIDLRDNTGRYRPAWESLPIDDGSFQFSTAVPGVYRLRFAAAFPYLEQDVMVTANAP
jgi:hypothetical protein